MKETGDSAAQQMSPSTAPASTEASWSRSPMRMSRACGGSAVTSAVMSGRSTIEASSTITTSQGSGLRSLWRKPVEPGMVPSRRWIVVTWLGIARFTSSAHGSASRSEVMDDASRAAALPVGAAIAIRIRASPGCSSNRPRMRTTVVVLPVPGPPEMTEKCRRSAASAACRWRSSPDLSTPK